MKQMSSMKKCKAVAVCLRLLATLTSVGLPAVAVWQEFPIFKAPVSPRELGAGGILLLLILLFGLRRQLWPYLRDRLHLRSGGALILWGLLFGALWWLEQAAALLPSLRTVCLAGVIGAGAGLIADTAAGLLSRRREGEVSGDA